MIKIMKDMTEPELKEYFNLLMSAIQELLPSDVKGFMILVATDQDILQYAGSVERLGGIGVLRELADRLERNMTVRR